MSENPLFTIILRILFSCAWHQYSYAPHAIIPLLYL